MNEFDIYCLCAVIMIVMIGSFALGMAVASRRQDEIQSKAESLYHELIMQVERKFPGESRHDTAKRYIQEAERFSGESEALSDNEIPSIE